MLKAVLTAVLAVCAGTCFADSREAFVVTNIECDVELNSYGTTTQAVFWGPGKCPIAWCYIIKNRERIQDHLKPGYYTTTVRKWRPDAYDAYHFDPVDVELRIQVRSVFTSHGFDLLHAAPVSYSGYGFSYHQILKPIKASPYRR